MELAGSEKQAVVPCSGLLQFDFSESLDDPRHTACAIVTLLRAQFLAMAHGLP